MPEVERHQRQSIGDLWGVALFLSLPLRFQPRSTRRESAREPPAEARMRAHFPQGGELFFNMKRPAPIGQKAQPPADCLARETVETLKRGAAQCLHTGRPPKVLEGGSRASSGPSRRCQFMQVLGQPRLFR
jgi:hypothetical protein